MFDTLTRQSNRVLSTVGVAIALLLAVNLGILLKSHFLQPPYNLATVTTYFFIFLGTISYVSYFTIRQLDSPAYEYVEGLVLGLCGSTAILVYLPNILFEPIAVRLDGVMSFFVVIYLFAIGATALLTAVVVRGAELYASGNTSDPDDTVVLSQVDHMGNVSNFGEQEER